MGVFFKSIHPPQEEVFQVNLPTRKVLQRGMASTIRIDYCFRFYFGSEAGMGRKEYGMIEIVDVLRRYQQGDGIRAIARSTGIDRNTVRKYYASNALEHFGEVLSVISEIAKPHPFRAPPGAQ
jgi:hypothetical protein